MLTTIHTPFFPIMKNHASCGTLEKTDAPLSSTFRPGFLGGIRQDSGEILHVPRAYHGQSPNFRCGWNIPLSAAPGKKDGIF